MPLEISAGAQGISAKVKGMVSRGVKSACVTNGRLIFTLTDNSTLDLGQVTPVEGLHAGMHASGCADAVSPESIGAAATAHSHAQSDVTGLETALSGKAAAAHASAHASGGADALTPSSIGAASAAHSHAQSDVTGLESALSGKAAASHASAHASGGADAVTPASIGAATRRNYTATLLSTGWSASAPYTQSVTVTGLLATDTGSVDAELSGAASTDAGIAILEAWSCVSRIYASAANTLTAVCYEDKPEVGIPLNLEVLR